MAKNNEKCAAARKTSIGGQAVIEGLVMKGPSQTCLAVRLPDGSIHTEMYPENKPAVMKIPLVRGAYAMVRSLLHGYRYINRSADLAYPDGESMSEFDKKMEKKLGKSAYENLGIVTALLGVVLAIALFIAVPTLLTALLGRYIELTGTLRAVIEGVIKIIVFLAYIAAVSHIKEIHRVFEYHGAEHKTIFCYEQGLELKVENARGCRRFHPRCGTSFLFIVIIISIAASVFAPAGNMVLRMLCKLLILPVVMGISYELIKFAGRHDNLLTRIISAPGLWVQRLTVFEPDDSQLEVAIASMKAVLPRDGESDVW